MISFVIPAHNEERNVAATIDSVTAAARAVGEPFEVVVVDDASTDRTAAVAADRGAAVIAVNNRQIAATRNAGARAATGDVLFFVDADTLANPAAVRAGLRELRRGAVGGGCVFTFDGRLPLWAACAYPVAVFFARFLKLLGGCFLFCTREAFDAVGGFDETYFAAEEAVFIAALKKRGRFAVPVPTVVTSGRKLRAFSVWQILDVAWRWAILDPHTLRRREGLDVWYGPAARDPLPKVEPTP
jgi:glycosyltransferase involved in cell wall biosynthesis